MMAVCEWMVWSLFVFITVFEGAAWLALKGKEGKIEEQKRTPFTIGFLLGFPRIFLWEMTILVLFVFVDFNKLNLLWIYPLVWYLLIKNIKYLDKDGKVKQVGLQHKMDRQFRRPRNS